MAASLEAVQRLLGAQRWREAADALVAAADAGDGAACAELAGWRIAGNLIRRDLAAARALLGRAWVGGDSAAGLLHAGFLASGVGGPADWPGALRVLRALAPTTPPAAAQLRLIAAMALTDDGDPADPIPARELSASPHVTLAEALFTPAECAHLLAVGEPWFKRSLVVDPATGRMVPHPIRRSDGAMIGVHTEDVVIAALNRRIAALSGTLPEQGEPLQLLRYGPADEYRAHLDTLAAEPNQRIATVIVYLTAEHEGGETRFIRTGLAVRGRVGDAILFRNVTDAGLPDRMAEHAGLPVTRGVKHIATRWIRARRFVYPPPQPLLDR
jgi:prolyl 4-hydroxylase